MCRNEHHDLEYDMEYPSPWYHPKILKPYEDCVLVNGDFVCPNVNPYTNVTFPAKFIPGPRMFSYKAFKLLPTTFPICPLEGNKTFWQTPLGYEKCSDERSSVRPDPTYVPCYAYVRLKTYLFWSLLIFLIGFGFGVYRPYGYSFGINSYSYTIHTFAFIPFQILRTPLTPIFPNHMYIKFGAIKSYTKKWDKEIDI